MSVDGDGAAIAHGDADDEPPPAAPCRGHTQIIFERISRPDDSEQLAAAKYVTAQAVLPVVIFGGIALLLVSFEETARYVGIIIGTLSLTLLLVYAVATRNMTVRHLELALISCTFATICIDWNSAAAGVVRFWPWMVIVMDILLLAGSSDLMQMVPMTLTTIWLVVDSSEVAFRWGVYDLDGWSKPTEELVDRMKGCANPPCAAGLVPGLMTLGVFLFSFYVDFAATRGFSTGQRKERDRVLASISVASQVAASLVRFDLEEAETALDQATGTLPGALQRSFRNLLINLASYRPYLPQSCLVPDDEEHPTSSDSATTSRVAWGAPAERTAERTAGSEGSRSRRSTAASTASASGAAVDNGGRVTPREDHGEQRSFSAAGGARASRTNELLTDSPLCARKSLAGRRFSTTSRNAEVVTTGRKAHQVAPKRATLLVCNRRGFLGGYGKAHPAGRVTIPQLQTFISGEVEAFVAATQSLKGVVDLLSADHMFASYSAAKHLSAHRANATRCGATLTGLVADPQDPRPRSGPKSRSRLPSRLPSFVLQEPEEECDAQEALVGARTVAVCSGSAVCGDFGSASAQRFMAIGGLSSTLGMMDRLAARWGVPLLTDGLVQDDISDFWLTRIRKLVMYPKRGTRTPVKLWEVLGERKVGSDDEWMYNLQGATPNPWAAYNDAVAKWAAGSADAALGCIAAALGSSESPAAPRAHALTALQQLISEDASPIASASDAGADAGDPFPVA
eukprot:TRINITY_DN582_c1_g3_i1.p1 TRINITY_DN582_c1_g3~~TRINITY_DN582_c1_g3_i1.p1  ORF type:complete len:740 (+),score=168.64 TRINITY_DN582_c1_g3_i1:179-2398(+)